MQRNCLCTDPRSGSAGHAPPPAVMKDACSLFGLKVRGHAPPPAARGRGAGKPPPLGESRSYQLLPAALGESRSLKLLPAALGESRSLQLLPAALGEGRSLQLLRNTILAAGNESFHYSGSLRLLRNTILVTACHFITAGHYGFCATHVAASRLWSDSFERSCSLHRILAARFRPLSMRNQEISSPLSKGFQ